MQVSGLFVYPVKSLRGISLERSEVGLRGLKLDRHWMVVDENGKFRTQRQLPQMTLISTSIGDELVLSAPGCGQVAVPLGATGETIEGTVWGWTGPVRVVDERADRWLSEVLEMPCRLVTMAEEAYRPAGDGEIDFADGMPVLFAGEASLNDLNSKLEEAIPMDRFRANVIFSGAPPYAEDGWESVRVGDVPFKFGKRCGRCLVTTTDQQTGVRHPGEEPLRTLARDREAKFGSYYLPRWEGTIAVGDELTVV